MNRTLLTLALAASIGGCSQSHDTCAGSAPSCLRGLDGARECCLDGPGDSAPATCRADTWVCPDNFYHRAQCARIGAACFIDAGVPDADTSCRGPTPLCYPRWGDSDCCLDDPSPASCVAGSFQCPRGSARLDACDRVDPFCETLDAGPADSAVMGPYDDCAEHSECVLTSAGCCDVCGRPSAADVVPVASARQSDYYREVACPGDEPVACPDCPTQLDPHLVAYCDTAPFRPVCQLADFSAPPYSPCESDAECVLTTPQCCPCGDIPLFETIAVRADHVGEIGELLCELSGACPPCVPFYDESARAACVEGACAVVVD